jgi:hypothetical protein
MSRRRITAALGAAAVTLILATGGAAGRAGGPPGQQPPSDQTPPSISGSAVVASTLTASTGTWQGKSLKFAYQWLRCDSAGGNCSAISGATAAGKTLSTADAGSSLRVIVTASNRNGSTAATSAQTAAVLTAASPPPASPPPTTTSVAPAESSLPVVSGTAQQNQNLTTSTGSWSGTTPMTYSYQWQRCDSGGASCAPVSGATAPSYVLTTADVGSSIRASVTASNSAGSATASSTATAPVSAVTSASTAPVCNGCYLEDKLDGSLGSGWLTEISDAFGGTGTGSISFIPGLFGQAAREFVPAAASLDYSKRQLVGFYRGNGDPAIHTNVGETTWYRVFFRDDSNVVPANTDGYWFEAWHESVSGSGNSMAFGLYADNPNNNGVGANARFLFRPGGGVEGSPIYHHYYSTPGSFQLHHWYDIVAKVTWGSTPSTGALSIWIDGQPFSAAASNGPSGENFTNGQGVPTMYQKLDGTYDHPSFDPGLNYCHQVPWDLVHDFDEVLVGPTAASIGFAP